MLIETRRFGLLDVNEDQVLTIRGPVPPFDRTTEYVLLPHRVGPPFNWLQAVQGEDLAFIVAPPGPFFPWYQPPLPGCELEEVGAGSLAEVLTLVILTPRKEERAVSANLLAPLILGRRTGRGRQVVLQGSGYHTRHPLVEGVGGSGEAVLGVRAAEAATEGLRATA
jgi:flagellar assembly factor FliW